MAKKSVRPDLESLFVTICRYKPSKECLKQLRGYSDQQTVVRFLVGKLQVLIDKSDSTDEWDSTLEWGVVHACKLLGEFKAEEAILPLLEIIDCLKDDQDTYLYSAAMTALEQAGPKALEPAYHRYERDRNDPDHASTWAYVLANLGVKDRRIYQVLLDHMAIDSTEAVMLMADYGDQDLLLIVEGYVKKAAEYLNDNRLDPFIRSARIQDVIVGDYIDSRESLVMLREGIPIDHPGFDSKVEELDRQLLRYADFSVYDRSEEPLQKVQKIGRNEPCPCGSGKKYKKCCGGT